MRLYGKRFMTNRTDARVQDRKESRDAVVYDIDENNRWCRVRVAGSETLVRAWFPANFMRAPQWLKVGVAVRIAHVGGDKSRIEVVSPGLVQPTYVMPPLQGGVDTILLGMYPTAPIDSAGWTVDISTGSFRIGGRQYSFSPGGPSMDEENWHMGDGGDMSGTYWWGSVDPIAATEGLWFRYDAFVVGNDSVVDYVKGEEWEWNPGPGGAGREGPTKPTVPSNHVLIRSSILVWSGTTSITQANIGKEWEAPRADHLDVVYGYAGPAYGTTEDYKRTQEGVGVIYGGPGVYVPSSPGGHNRGSVGGDMNASATISVMDQYGNPYSWWSSGSINTLEFRSLGSELYNGYGVGTTSGGAIPSPTGETGSGPAVSMNLGLGYQTTLSYVRKHSYIAQPDNGADGYPGYDRGDADSHTAIYQVSLISADAIHPVTAILTFYNLDGAGNPQ